MHKINEETFDIINSNSKYQLHYLLLTTYTAITTIAAVKSKTKNNRQSRQQESTIKRHQKLQLQQRLLQ